MINSQPSALDQSQSRIYCPLIHDNGRTSNIESASEGWPMFESDNDSHTLGVKTCRYKHEYLIRIINYPQIALFVQLCQLKVRDSKRRDRHLWKWKLKGQFYRVTLMKQV